MVGRRWVRSAPCTGRRPAPSAYTPSPCPSSCPSSSSPTHHIPRRPAPPGTSRRPPRARASRRAARRGRRARGGRGRWAGPGTRGWRARRTWVVCGGVRGRSGREWVRGLGRLVGLRRDVPVWCWSGCSVFVASAMGLVVVAAEGPCRWAGGDRDSVGYGRTRSLHQPISDERGASPGRLSRAGGIKVPGFFARLNL